MPTTNSVPRGQKTVKGSGSEPESTQGAGKTGGFRTPVPRVLARFPDLDAKEGGVEVPTETLPSFEGRFVHQKLAMRILVGVAVVLVLMAVLPKMFQEKGAGDSDGTASSKPSWQPENPAPDALAAPPWNGGGQVTDSAIGSADVRPVELPPMDYQAGPDAAARSAVVPATELAAENVGHPGDGNENRWEQQATTLNREQSLVSADEAARMDYRPGVSPNADSGANSYYPQNSTVNRASAIPDSQLPAAGYGNGYQADASAQPYRQGYGAGAYAEQSGRYDTAGRDGNRPAAPTAYQEPAATYPSYADNGSSGSSYEAGYRSSAASTPSQAYDAGSQGIGGGSADYRDYRQAATGNYRQPDTNDYRQMPVADYRQMPVADYRQSATSDYRQSAAADYRQGAVPDYRQASQPVNSGAGSTSGYPAQPYRSGYGDPRQNELPQQQYGSGYSQESGGYPSTGIQNGTGAGVAPAQGTSYYQADRRNEAGTGNASYGDQPGAAYFQGTIEQAPVNSGTRLY